MKLVGFKLYSQNDVLWKAKKLGTSTVSTIENFGCTLTSVCMVCNYFGKEITPDVLNDQLKSKNGFTKGTLINWGAVTDVFPDILVDWPNFIDCSTVDAPLDKIDAILFSKRPVIVKVDYDQNLSGLQEHWIVIIGKTEDGAYLCADPWGGEEIFFNARYGDPVKNIYKIVVYNGVPKNTTSDADTITELQNKIQTLNKTVAEGALENNNLRTELSAQEKENSDQATLLSDTRDKLDKATWTQTELEIKNKTLQEQVDALEKDKAQLTLDLGASQTQNTASYSAWTLIWMGIKKIRR